MAEEPTTPLQNVEEAMMGFLSLLAKVERPFCANCDTNDLSPMYYCNTCGQALCAKCRSETHQAKMFSQHDISDVSKFTREPQRKCLTHSEPYIMFSPVSETLLCINCFRDISNEERPQCLDLDTAYAQRCDALKRAMDAVTDLEAKVKEEVAIHRGLLKDLQINAMREESTIHVFAKILRSTITQTEDKLIEDVKRQLQSKEKLLEDKLRSLESLISNLQAYLTLSTAFESSASKYEVLKMAAGLIERLAAIGGIVHPSKPAQDSSLILSEFKAEFAASLGLVLQTSAWEAALLKTPEENDIEIVSKSEVDVKIVGASDLPQLNRAWSSLQDLHTENIILDQQACETRHPTPIGGDLLQSHLPESNTGDQENILTDVVEQESKKDAVVQLRGTGYSADGQVARPSSMILKEDMGANKSTLRRPTSLEMRAEHVNMFADSFPLSCPHVPDHELRNPQERCLSDSRNATSGREERPREVMRTMKKSHSEERQHPDRAKLSDDTKRKRSRNGKSHHQPRLHKSLERPKSPIRHAFHEYHYGRRDPHYDLGQVELFATIKSKKAVLQGAQNFLVTSLVGLRRSLASANDRNVPVSQVAAVSVHSTHHSMAGVPISSLTSSATGQQKPKDLRCTSSNFPPDLLRPTAMTDWSGLMTPDYMDMHSQTLSNAANPGSSRDAHRDSRTMSEGGRKVTDTGHSCVVQAMVHQDELQLSRKGQLSENLYERLAPLTPKTSTTASTTTTSTTSAQSSQEPREIELSGEELRQLIRVLRSLGSSEPHSHAHSTLPSNPSRYASAGNLEDMRRYGGNNRRSPAAPPPPLRRSESFEGHEEAVEMLVTAVQEMRKICSPTRKLHN